MPPRDLYRVMLLGVCLHLLGMARSPLPAQDGLKFIRIAREFRSQPILDVIRSSDQHPLYPAAIACLEPLTRCLTGEGPGSWTTAAQAVSLLATVLTLWPLFALTTGLFDRGAGLLAALLWLVLPLSAHLGHDTLSDPLALLAFTTALHFGLRAWRSEAPRDAALCGLAAGIGYWARPEVAVVALAWCLAAAGRALARLVRSSDRRLRIPRPGPIAALSLTLLAGVGGYAACKGEVSEKLALRRATGVDTRHGVIRSAAPWLPPGLDDPRWDFSPKEEPRRPERAALGAAIVGTGMKWFEAMGWVLAPLSLWGAVRTPGRAGGWFVAVFLAVFGAILVRHSAALGYLSTRHTMALVMACLPWAAAGLRDIFCRWCVPLSAVLAWRPRRSLGYLAVVVLGVAVQARPAHASRRGHEEAGRWLARHARQGEAVLDTRGWAAFLSGLRSYDPWHIAQALSDSRLAYVVIGCDELESDSRRAETWRKILAHAGDLAGSFPPGCDRQRETVRVYRFDPSASWEELAP